MFSQEGSIVDSQPSQIMDVRRKPSAESYSAKNPDLELSAGHPNANAAPTRIHFTAKNRMFQNIYSSHDIY